MIIIATGSRPFHPPGVPFDDVDVLDSDAAAAARPPAEEPRRRRRRRGRLRVRVDLHRPRRRRDARRQRPAAAPVHGRGDRRAPGGDLPGGRHARGAERGPRHRGSHVVGLAGRAGERRGAHPREGDLRDRTGGQHRRRSGSKPPAWRPTSGVGSSSTSTTARPRRASMPPATSSALRRSRPCRWSRRASRRAGPSTSRSSGRPMQLPPYGVYSVPEVAMVGLTEEAAAAEGIDYAVGRARLRLQHPGRHLGRGRGHGQARVRARPRCGCSACTCWARRPPSSSTSARPSSHFGGTIEYFISSTFNVPTMSEAYKYAAYDGLSQASP